LWSGVNVGIPFNRTFPQNRDPSTQGIIGSCFALGNFVACIITAFIGGKLGRKKTIFIGATISGFGVLLQATAFSLPQLVVGRVLNGIGNVS
jgi:MFS family permease